MRRALLLLALLALPMVARAQLALRSSTLVNGSFAVVGNTVVDCPSTSVCDNNTTILSPVDKDPLVLGDRDGDGDDDTTASSAATLVLPSGAVVRSATLYVGAYAADVTTRPFGPGWITGTLDPADFGALFVPPGGTSYVAITPLAVIPVEVDCGYQARFDVTSLVTGAGQAWLANPRISPSTHPYQRTLWWSLVVVYEDGGAPKLINLYDGVFQCVDNTTLVTLDGFRTPATGPISARFSTWCEDGKAAVLGESIKVGTVSMSNSANPSNNIGNSSVSDPSGAIVRDPMTIKVTESVDIDSFDASTAFTNSQTSATVDFTCGALEGVYYHGAVLAFDVLAPTVTVTKSVSDLNGGAVLAGDELEYTIVTAVSGADDAAGVILRDAIPEGTTLVAGTIEVVDGAAAGLKTEAPGDDEAELAGGDLVVRLGEGANASDGGAMAVGVTRTVKFRVLVGAIVAPRTIVNVGRVSLRAASGGPTAPLATVLSNEAAVDAVPPPDLAPAADLAVPDDLTAPVDDLALSPDLALSIDLAGGADLSLSHDGSFTTVDLTSPTTGAPKSGCGCHLTSPRADAEGALAGALLLLAIWAHRAWRSRHRVA